MAGSSFELAQVFLQFRQAGGKQGFGAVGLAAHGEVEIQGQDPDQRPRQGDHHQALLPKQQGQADDG